MSAPPEHQVISEMCRKGSWHSIEPVAELLIALGYPDVAKELRSRWDELQPEEEDEF